MYISIYVHVHCTYEYIESNWEIYFDSFNIYCLYKQIDIIEEFVLNYVHTIFLILKLKLKVYKNSNVNKNINSVFIILDSRSCFTSFSIFLIRILQICLVAFLLTLQLIFKKKKFFGCIVIVVIFLILSS